MNYRKLGAALSELCWVVRLILWTKWQKLTNPNLWETTFRIKPENIILASWKPQQIHVTTNGEGKQVEYLHSFWDGTAYFAFLETKAKFTISVNDSRPSGRQIEFFRELLAKQESMWKVFEIEIHKHYGEYVYRHMDFYISKGENINDEVAPRIDSPAAMRRLLYTPSLIFDDHAPENKQFDLCFPCTWEPDRTGITITLCDWRVVSVH